MADGSRSSSAGIALENTGPIWLSWAMPSVVDLVFIAILASLVCTSFSSRLLNDASIGWHIRTGQQILATHSIPRVDPFSASMNGKRWFAWEWLYDAIVGSLQSKIGLNGVVWLTALVIAAVFAWMFHLALARGTNLVVALLLTLLAISASMIHFLTRPHVVTWWLALAWFWILESTERRSLFARDGLTARWLWFLPLSMVLWVNIHGGFLLGFVLLLLFWLAALWTRVTSKHTSIEESFQKIAAGKRLRNLTLIGILSAIASFANPYGWKLHAHIIGYLSNRFLMDHIEEFQSPNFHGTAQRGFLFLLLLAIVAIAGRSRQFPASELLVVLFAVYAGLYASRNIPVSSILIVLIIAPRLCSARASGFLHRMSAVDSRARGHLWPIVVSLVVLLIAFSGGKVGSQQLMNAQFSPWRMPFGAVNFLKQSGVGSPILSPDYWGGYLIYRLYPDAKVVIDDRHDFYGEPFLRDYLNTMHVEPGWQNFLQEQNPACLLLPKNAALTAILRQTSDWKAIYADETAVVFIPNGATKQGTEAGNR